MLTDAELDRNALACESQAHGVGDGAPAYIAIHAFRALIAQAREANALRQECERLRGERNSFRAKADLADEMAERLHEDVRIKTHGIELLPQFEADWLTRYTHLTATKPKEG